MRFLSGAASATRGAGGAARRTGRFATQGAGGFGRLVNRATNASGAGTSGLAQLIRLHAFNQAADALVALSLAGTLFFGVPTDEARGRVALYLLITMAPFAVVAPLIGPLLDRMRSGRRYALAGTMLARGLLCWAMASALGPGGPDAVTLYPAAFGVLVLSKAYGVTRSAAIPRMLPPQISLVTANARLSLGGTAGAACGAGIAALVAWLAGPAWMLRVTTLVFLAGIIFAARLPAKVESTRDERAARPAESLRPGRVRLGPMVKEAMGANAGIRAFSGFLTFFLAFLVRSGTAIGVPATAALGMLVVAAGVGGLIGTGIGARARSLVPHVIVLATLTLTLVAAGLGAWLYGLVAAIGVAAAAGFAQALGKFGLDATIQRDVAEETRSSAFARSETLLQMSWVVGGGMGLALSLVPNGTLGLALAAAGLAITLAFLALRRRRRQGRPNRRPVPPARARGATE